MSCWFSCFYATLLPWPRAVIKQQAYKKTIAPVHFRRLCQGFNSEINSEETFMNVLMAAPESQLIGWECFYNLFVSGDTLLLQISLVAHVNVVEDWSDHRRGQQLNWNKSFIREQYLVYHIHGGGGVLLSLDFDGDQVWSGFTERERERECVGLELKLWVIWRNRNLLNVAQIHGRSRLERGNVKAHKATDIDLKFIIDFVNQ